MHHLQVVEDMKIDLCSVVVLSSDKKHGDSARSSLEHEQKWLVGIEQAGRRPSFAALKENRRRPITRSFSFIFCLGGRRTWGNDGRYRWWEGPDVRESQVRSTFF